MNFDNLKHFMDDMAARYTPGNAVSVYIGGKKVYEYACGVSDIASEKPLSGDEYFNIYSCSKVATVTAAMQLVERGIIRINDPLYEYIPEYRDMYVKSESGIKKAQKPITLGDLFAMTSGLDYEFDTGAMRAARIKTNGRMDTLEVVKCLASEPLSFEPGTHWQYSLSHDVLAGVVETVSGKKFRDYMRENIFEPLGMDKTVYHHTPEIEANMMSQYHYEPEQNILGKIVPEQFRDIGKPVYGYVLGEEYDSGGAGITSTVGDYVKLAAALSLGGKYNGERILSPYSIELMKVNRLGNEQLADFNWQGLEGYGYGLGVRTHMNRALSGSLSSIGEFGWGGAAGANMFVDTNLQLAVFYVQHTMNQKDPKSEMRLRNAIYSCL